MTSGGGLRPLHRTMQRLFQDSFPVPSFLEGAARTAGMAVANLRETTDGYPVQLLLPGMRLATMQVSVGQGVCSASGQPALGVPEDAKPLWQSVGSQAGYRVQVPTKVDASAAAWSIWGWGVSRGATGASRAARCSRRSSWPSSSVPWNPAGSPSWWTR